MKITVSDIMSLGPCPDYTRKVVESLWSGRESLTLSDILDLDIPEADRIWAVSQLLPLRERLLFCADCTESVLHVFEDVFPDDMRVRNCIQSIRGFADGLISGEELRAASRAAWAAAEAAGAAARAAYAARDAAGAADAAWAAAGSARAAAPAARDAAGAAWDGARGGARGAAWAADAAGSARAAARAARGGWTAEVEKQMEFLRRYVAEIEGKE